MDTIKYFIKIGERYLSWVDDNWYETNKKSPSYFDTLVEIKNAIAKLANHYIYKPLVFEAINYDLINAKEIKLYKEPKKDPYFDKEDKPAKIKCIFKF